MYELANTTVSILRGTSYDEYGDPMDSGTVIVSNLPAAINLAGPSSVPRLEGVKVYEPASEVPSVTRYFNCTLPSGTDITLSDQVLDERSNLTYEVAEVSDLGWQYFQPDLFVILKRVTFTAQT